MKIKAEEEKNKEKTKKKRIKEEGGETGAEGREEGRKKIIIKISKHEHEHERQAQDPQSEPGAQPRSAVAGIGRRDQTRAGGIRYLSIIYSLLHSSDDGNFNNRGWRAGVGSVGECVTESERERETPPVTGREGERESERARV